MTQTKKCDENCEQLEKCKRLMGLPKNWVFPKWRERTARAIEVEHGLAHCKENHPVIWELINK
jgi:hypothetical protein